MDKKNQGETDTEAEIAAEGAGEKELSLRYENRRQVAKGGILGFFIGLAVIVPGVSGSAVAIIFKLYEKLPYALGSFFRKFKTCLLFLLPIAIGLVVGFVLGFFGVRELLHLLPFAAVALFAGLMTGAYPAVTDQLKGARPPKGAYRLVSCRACRPDSDFGGHRLFFGGGTLSRSSRRGAVHFVSRSRHCIVCHRRSCGVLFRQIRARKGKNGKIVKNLS